MVLNLITPKDWSCHHELIVFTTYLGCNRLNVVKSLQELSLGGEMVSSCHYPRLSQAEAHSYLYWHSVGSVSCTIRHYNLLFYI